MSFIPTTSNFITGAQTFGAVGNNSTTVNAINMNANILHTNNCAANNVINSTMPKTTVIQSGLGSGVQKNNNNITNNQQLYHVIPIAASNVNSLQIAHANMPQNSTMISNKNMANVKINNSSHSSSNSNQHITKDIQSSIAQIIGTALPIQNVVATTNVTSTGIVNKYGSTTIKPVQGLTVVQTGLVAPVLNATTATVIQLPATANLQRVFAAPVVAPLPPATTLTTMSTPGTFSMINPNINSKLQTSQFVINSGAPKSATIKINANAMATMLPMPNKTKIMEIKTKEMEINNKPTITTTTIVATTPQTQQKIQPQTTATTMLLPKQTAITPMTSKSTTTTTTANNAITTTGIQCKSQQINEINLEKLLPETTITKEPVKIMTMAMSSATNNSSSSSSKNNNNTNTTLTITVPNDTPTGLKITKINSLAEDLDKADDNMLVIDDSSDDDSLNDLDEELLNDDADDDDNVNENESIADGNSNSASDELSKSPPRIRHISNSVVLTKADTRTNGGSRCSLNDEPANVVLMKIPNASQQQVVGGVKPQNMAMTINEALTMSKENLTNIETRSPPILLTRSNSIPEASKTLSPRANKRTQSLNYSGVGVVGSLMPKSDEQKPIKTSEQENIFDIDEDDNDNDEITEKSNDELNNSNAEITFIELDDSFDENYTDESDDTKSKPTTPKLNKSSSNNNNQKNPIATPATTTSLDKNDNIKSNKVETVNKQQPTTTDQQQQPQKSPQQLKDTSTQKIQQQQQQAQPLKNVKINADGSLKNSSNNEIDEQMIKSLLCNEKITAVTPSSTISGSSLQEVSPPKLSSNANLPKTSTTRSSLTTTTTTTTTTSHQPLQTTELQATTTAINNKNNNNFNTATLSNSANIATPNANARRLCRDNSIASALSMVSTFDMLNWKDDRIGTARGTAMRFELNEFNLLQLHERNCPPRFRIHAAYERPIYERTFGLTPKPDNSDPMLYMCRKCKTYGPAVDFLAPEFCSYTCLRRTGTKRTAQTSNEVIDNFGIKRVRKNLATTSTSNAIDVASNTKSNSTAYANTIQGLPKFRWSTYLAAMRSAYAAPIDLFLNPFPTGPNPFTIGMKLEAIDPENCSLFCVCTVAQIQGYRLRLNFDGYDSIYDFYVNADSMDIFPPGWCERTKRLLQPPRHYNSTRPFNWNDYLKKTNATPADKKLFTHLNGGSMANRNPFQVGMFLEADDLNDTGKLCVASVADVLDERIRVHFDGWDDCYDYWVDISSPYIHPCGWHEGRQQLLVPPEYGNTSFNWREYIMEANTGIAAPEDFFIARDPIDYRPGMKLEVVDPRNPSLIRPASVVHRTRHRVKIIFDCWPIDYTFVLEDDSPDLHPIGWCDATGHELEPPPGYQQFKKIMPCNTPGCRGIGNMNRNNGRSHATHEACPYTPENWRSKCEKTPRVEGRQILRTFTQTAPQVAAIAVTTQKDPIVAIKEEQPKNKQTSTATESLPLSPLVPSVLPIKYPTRGRPRKVDRQAAIARQQELQAIKMQRSLSPSVAPEKIKTERKSIEAVPTGTGTTSISTPASLPSTPQIKIEAVVSNGISAHHKLASTQTLDPNVATVKRFLCDYGPRLQQNYGLWRENLVGFDIGKKVHVNPLNWTTSQTCDFLSDVLTEENLNCDVLLKFTHHDIDGSALLMLQQQDLIDLLELKLGPALKICAIILQLRILVATKYESSLSANGNISEESNNNKHPKNSESETECSVK